MQNMVEVKPLAAFVGAFPCSVAEADAIVEVFVEDEDGNVKKRREGRRRYSGFVPVTRRMTPTEVADQKAGNLSSRIEVIADGVCVEHPEHATLFVPEEIAADLVSRDLAEIVGAAGGPKRGLRSRVKPADNG